MKCSRVYSYACVLSTFKSSLRKGRTPYMETCLIWIPESALRNDAATIGGHVVFLEGSWYRFCVSVCPLLITFVKENHKFIKFCISPTSPSFQVPTRVYPKVSGLATWSENCKSYSSLPLGAVVSLFCESV
jgi:hypothetical protein